MRYIDSLLDLEVGGILTRHNWDLYAVFAIVDRGDLDRPATTLPILDGGFDQRQILFGVRHRFDTAKSNDSDE